MHWTASTFTGAILFFMKDFNLNTINGACKEKANEANKCSLGGLASRLFGKYLQ